jgi:Recombination endonuclease VII
MQTKTCTKCLLPLPLKMFDNLKHGSLGKHPNCKKCRANYESDRWKALPQEHKTRLRKKKRESDRETTLIEFGFTLESFQQAVNAIDGKCEICFKQVGDSLCIDHCHSTGMFRGFLCSTCNMGLGMFQDNESILRNAIHYLHKHQ